MHENGHRSAAIPMPESWYLPHSPVPTRMPSTRACRHFIERNSEYWEVPYLPIDPSDIGREYEPIVRINSQSGKGGVAFVMDTFFGFKLPKGMHKEFADVIQKIAEQQGEVAPEQIMEEFQKNYLDRKEPIPLQKVQDHRYRDCRTAISPPWPWSPTPTMESKNSLRALETAPSTLSSAAWRKSWASISRSWITASMH